MLTDTQISLPPQPKAWSKNIAQIAQEFELTPLSLLSGHIPEGIRGTLYRNGPGRLERGGQKVGHWFDGDGAILATECFVTKDVPPYALVGGNPAKIIKYRFSEEQIKDLLEIKWWDWEDEKIKQSVPLLVSDNIDEFIKYAKSNVI